MRRKKVNEKMKKLANAGLLDNFSKSQLECLRQLIKNQPEFIIIENDRIETEKSLFKAKQLLP